jgi:hypothetical protein
MFNCFRQLNKPTRIKFYGNYSILQIYQYLCILRTNVCILCHMSHEFSKMWYFFSNGNTLSFCIENRVHSKVNDAHYAFFIDYLNEWINKLILTWLSICSWNTYVFAIFVLNGTLNWLPHFIKFTSTFVTTTFCVCLTNFVT